MADNFITRSRPAQWLARNIQSLKAAIIKAWKGRSVSVPQDTQPTKGFKSEAARAGNTALADRQVKTKSAQPTQPRSIKSSKLSPAKHSELKKCREAVDYALSRYNTLKPRLDRTVPAMNPGERNNKARALIAACAVHLAKTQPNTFAANDSKLAFDLVIKNIAQCDPKTLPEETPKNIKRYDQNALGYAPSQAAYEQHKEMQNDSLLGNIANGDIPDFWELKGQMTERGSFQTFETLVQKDPKLRQYLVAVEDCPDSFREDS